METAKFVIYGKPMGKQRPRLGKGFTYTPKETVNYENLVKYSFLDQVKDWVMTDKPIEMQITAYFPIPNSTSKKNKELMRSGQLKPTKKPDTDNIGKMIADALNNLAYNDDAQVVDMSIRKVYSDTPRVEVTLIED